MSKPATPLTELSAEECLALLATTDLGRLAVIRDETPDIFPVNYLLGGNGKVYFRSAPGTKLIDITLYPAVAFEADGTADGERWSVVVRGEAHRLEYDSEIEESGIHELRSYSPTEKWNYVRIDPRIVSGRRFRRVHSPIRSA